MDVEKLGAFYLGRRYDPEGRRLLPDAILYDAKDLTTHALVVGMTGSGKTGLSVVLIEEAAIDGIPALVIDPKGDMGNLLLTFPELRGSDFRPWIDEREAARQGLTPDELAERVAEKWRSGLAEWGQSPERIARFESSVERVIYTPGSSSGVPLALLRSLGAPSPALAADEEALRERIVTATSGLVGLVGLAEDPLRSREHILVSLLLERAWSKRRDLDLPRLLEEIQSPPFEKMGAMDLETFYPRDERFRLAASLNHLLASPGFSAWREGEPLDVPRLLFTEHGKPRLAIFTLSHLSDSERKRGLSSPSCLLRPGTFRMSDAKAFQDTTPPSASRRTLHPVKSGAPATVC